MGKRNKKPIIVVPSHGSIHDLVNAIADGLENLSPKQRGKFQKAFREAGIIQQQNLCENATLAWMKKNNVPPTPENYFALAYLGDEPPEEPNPDDIIAVGKLKAESARLMEMEEIPSLDEVLDAIAKVRKDYIARQRALWKHELEAELKARAKKG